MRNKTVFAVGCCIALSACATLGYAVGVADGDIQAREDITAQCVRTHSFEFRTYHYVCELTTESAERVFSHDVDT